MALEALKSSDLDAVTKDNYSLVLNLAAVDVDEHLEFVKQVIAKFNVPPLEVRSIFDSDKSRKILQMPELKSAAKTRQGLLYRQVKFAYSRENPIAFAELVALCTSPGSLSWPAVERLIGIYSLDPTSVLGVLFDTCIALGLVETFVQIVESGGPWEIAQVLDCIAWRIWHAEEWRETLRFATKLIAAGLLPFEDIYVLFGPDSTYYQSAQFHWEDKLAADAGASQFNALANAQSLDGPAASKKQRNPLEHRQYFVEYLLESGLDQHAQSIIHKFPLIVQINKRVAEHYKRKLLENLQTQNIAENHTYLSLLGPLLGLDLDLVTLICSKIIALPEQEALETFRQWVLPAISVVEQDEAIDEIWKVLATFSQTERYALYTEWQFSVPRHYKLVKYALQRAEKNTKGILKRVSNDNTQQMLTLFAEQARLNPYTAFSVFLSQVESYDKIGQLMLEQLNYSEMAWDVLPLVIMVQLTSGRSQHDGLHDSKWIQAISSFTARLAAKADKFDCSKILVFVLKQFHQNDFSNLIVLKDMIMHMSGCIRLNELSMDQIEQLSSHKTIREAALKKLGGPDPSTATLDRLLGALKENNITLEIFVALCYGYRNYLASQNQQHLAPPKLLSYRLDEFTMTIQQYSALLAKMPYDEFAELIDPIPRLLNKYGVPVAMAMALWRPFLVESINKNDKDSDVLAPIIQRLPSTSETFSVNFFLTAWTLETYELKKFAKAYEDHKSQTHKPHVGAKLHDLVVEKTESRLADEQRNWLSKPTEELARKRAIQLDLLTKVLLPRALYSPLDAVFVPQFLTKMCRVGTLNFNYISLVDTIFAGSLLYNTLISCTAYEAENLGIFLAALFTWLLEYTTTPSAFNALAFAKPENGVKTVSACLLRRRLDSDASRESRLDLTYNRRDLFEAVRRWQTLLITRVLTVALASKEYMVVRNAITVTKLCQHEVFKLVAGGASQVRSAVQKLADKDSRADIKLAATALSGQLAHIVKQQPLDFAEDQHRDIDRVSGRLPERSSDRDDGNSDPWREDTSRDSRGSAEASEPKERDSRESRDSRHNDVRDQRDQRDSRDSRGPRGARDARDKDSREKDSRDKDTRDSKDSRDSRDSAEPKDSRDSRGSRTPRDSRDAARSIPARPERPASSDPDWFKERVENKNRGDIDRRGDDGRRDGGRREGRRDRDGGRDRRDRYGQRFGRYGRNGRDRDRNDRNDRNDRDLPPLPPPSSAPPGRDLKRFRRD